MFPRALRRSLAFVLLLAAASPLPGAEFTFDAKGGTLWVGDAQYMSVTLLPAFSDGPFSVKLAMNLELSDKYRFREGEWDTVQAVGSKFEYLRWGKLTDAFFVHVQQQFTKYTVGHGSIVDRFANNTFKQDLFMTGLHAGGTWSVLSVEYFTENVFDLDIHVARVVVQPFRSSTSDWLKSVKIGYTGALDLDINNRIGTARYKYRFTDDRSGPAVAINGLDVEVGLPSFLFVEWGAFLDVTRISRWGTGVSAGLTGKLFDSLTWRYEMQFASGQFITPWFDAYYLAERSDKYARLGTLSNRLVGQVVTLEQTIGEDELLDWSFTYKASTRDRASIEFTLETDPKLLWKLLSTELSYTRQGIYGLGDIFKLGKGTESLIEWRTSVRLGPSAVLEITYGKTFTRDEVSGTMVGEETTSLLMRSSF